MDPKFTGFSDYFSGFKVDNDDDNVLPNLNHFPNLQNHSGVEFDIPSPDLTFMNIPSPTPDLDQNSLIPSITISLDGGTTFIPSSTWNLGGESSSPTDSESSDPILKYISQMLMEENMEEKPFMFHDTLALQDTEKLLYEALGEDYPPSLDPPKIPVNLNVDSPDSYVSRNSSDFGGSGSSSASNGSGTGNSVDFQWASDDNSNHNPLLPTSLPGEFNFQSNLPQPSTLRFPFNLPNSLSNGSIGASVSELLVQNMFTESDSILQFNRGVEEASKFLPKGNQLSLTMETYKLGMGQREEGLKVEVKNEKEREHLPDVSRSRKNHERDEELILEEERSNKQSAVYVEEDEIESELSEMFDKVLLCHGKDKFGRCILDESPENRESKTSQEKGQLDGSNGGRGRSKKQGKNKETVDLRTLLILCAQAASTDDHRTAKELLKQIRQHSSPLGDGTQRLAHFFANGLEARLVGSGTGIHDFFNSLASKKTTAADMLKSYKVYLSACPFKKLPISFANYMILKVAEKASVLHIVDFGILYGFQWPILIQQLAELPGGPPKLRITGIEIPQCGFRPAERIEETGRRLQKYCDRFNVPFEYNPIASQKWETIRAEDLKVNKNEVLAVNCLFRFKNLLDETIEVNCPRNAVLNLIREINPDIFVHNIVNGAYNAPFFVTRFKEALFHFSALFDKFDATLPREDPARLMLEREFYGREVMNVIACEGLERVERPENYKQWQIRVMRAGFKQLPLDQELMKKFRAKLRACYHKDFVIDEDGSWFLQGWKGRIVYASSCWVPVKES